MKDLKSAVRDIAIAISEVSECMARISYDTEAISIQLDSDAASTYEVDRTSEGEIDQTPNGLRWGTKNATADEKISILSSCKRKMNSQADDIHTLSFARMKDIILLEDFSISSEACIYSNYIINDDWVYYIWSHRDVCGYPTRSGVLGRAKLDGTKNQLLADANSQDEGAQFYIEEGVLYFTSTDGKSHSLRIADIGKNFYDKSGGRNND